VAANRSAAGSSARCGPRAGPEARIRPGQLQQRERVAAGLGQDPVPDPLVDHPRQRGRQQRARVVVSDPLDAQLRQAVEVAGVTGLADGEHHGDPLRQQPARDEGQRLRGRAIEPLRVVDEAHQRL
jgi:hypothetical protein